MIFTRSLRVLANVGHVQHWTQQIAHSIVAMIFQKTRSKSNVSFHMTRATPVDFAGGQHWPTLSNTQKGLETGAS